MNDYKFNFGSFHIYASRIFKVCSSFLTLKPEIAAWHFLYQSIIMIIYFLFVQS